MRGPGRGDAHGRPRGRPRNNGAHTPTAPGASSVELHTVPHRTYGVPIGSGVPGSVVSAVVAGYAHVQRCLRIRRYRHPAALQCCLPISAILAHLKWSDLWRGTRQPALLTSNGGSCSSFWAGLGRGLRD